jgi:hypothetical protein
MLVGCPIILFAKGKKEGGLFPPSSPFLSSFLPPTGLVARQSPKVRPHPCPGPILWRLLDTRPVRECLRLSACIHPRFQSGENEYNMVGACRQYATYVGTGTFLGTMFQSTSISSLILRPCCFPLLLHCFPEKNTRSSILAAI